MSGRTKIWQQASQLIESLDSLTEKQAINQIDNTPGLSTQVKAAAKKLIELSASNELFDALIEQPFRQNSQPVKAGDILDQYQLSELIGQGGMSVVYRAHRTHSDVQKDVAIKVFNHSILPNSLLNQFQNEQEILSRLDHEHIVSMHHNGVTENGTAFIVMDFVQGATPIDQFVIRNKFSTKKITAMIRTIADTLGYAHSNLVIHRDIKPSNILVNNNGIIKIVDFGIAKLIDQQGGEDNPTWVALTPHYAAPEQIAENLVSVQADVFSLAAVFLGLLINGKPLPDDRLLKQCSTDEALVSNHLNSLAIDQDLKNIIHKGLQSEPQRRYKTMQAFTEDLWCWEHNLPIKATQDSWWYRIKKFSQRRRALFISLVTLVLTLTLGISALVWQIQQTRIEALKAIKVKDFMLNTYSVVDPDVSKGSDITAKNLLSTSYDEIKSDLSMDDDVRFELLQNMGIAHAQMGEYDQAIQILNESLAIEPDNLTSQIYLLQTMVANGQQTDAKSYLQTLKTPSSISTALQSRLLRAQIKLHSQNGEFEAAEQAVTRLKSVEATGVEDIQNNMAIAEMLFDQSKPAESIELLQQTLAEYQDTMANTNTRIMKLKYSLSSMYGTVGEPEKAKSILSQLLLDQAKILGESHPNYITTLVALASANRALGEMPEAIKNAQLAYDLSVKYKGENHLNSANALQMLGALTAVTGEYQNAIDLLTESVRVFELNTGVDNPNALDIKTDIGMLLGRIGEYEKSLTILENVYLKQNERLGSDHRSTIYVQMNLGLTHSYLGHHQQAIEINSSALKAAQEHLGDKHPISVNTLYALGRVYRSAEQYQQALETMLQIETKELLNPNDEKMAPYTKMVSRVYRELGQLDQAESYARRSLELNQQIYGVDSQAVATAKLFLAEFLLSTDNQEEGDSILKSIEQMIEKNNWQQSSIDQELQKLKRQ